MDAHSIPVDYDSVIRTCAVMLPRKKNILLMGQPGSGKSAISTGPIADLVSNGNYMLQHGCTMEAIDLRGLPSVDQKGMANFAPYGDLRRMLDATEPLLVIIEDLAHMDVSVQRAFMHIIHEREINGEKISDNVMFLATTNSKEDYGSGSNKIITPLLDRFDLVYRLTPDRKSWTKWANTEGLDPIVVGFANFKPDLLSTGGKSDTGLIEKTATFRSLHDLSDIIHAGCYSLTNAIAAIGVGPGTAFDDYKRTCHDMPTIEQIWTKPDTVNLPINKPGVLTAICQLIAQEVDPDHVEEFMTVMLRLPVEYSVVGMRSAVHKLPDLAYNDKFVEWYTEHKVVFENG